VRQGCSAHRERLSGWEEAVTQLEARSAATKYKARPAAAASILVLDWRSLPGSSSVRVGLRAVALESVFWLEVALETVFWLESVFWPSHRLGRALDVE
jgi:hypothetical protein